MEPENNKTSVRKNIKTIHTYESDMADAVRENQESVIKIALAEQKKREMNVAKNEVESMNTKNIILIVGGVILIIGAIWGAMFLIQKGKENSLVSDIQNKIPGLIAYDNQASIDTSGMTVKENLINALVPKFQKGKPASIQALFLTTNIDGKPTIISTSSFLNIANINMPGNLERSLSQQFMFGRYNGSITEETPNLFLIFQTKDYNQAFAGMLEWENTILDDLYALFNINISGDRAKLFQTPFKDIVIENKDARVLKDATGANVLYYMFIDKNTFVITETEDALKEILSRFNTKNIKPL